MRLPAPAALPDGLDACLAGRRSRRPDATHQPPTDADLATLLHHAAHAPSAGGLHVVRLYSAAHDALARYDPDKHALEPLGTDPNLLLEWMGPAMGNTTPPPAAVLLGHGSGPAEQKYGRAARRLVAMDAGAIYMTLGLVSAALGLMGCGVGPQTFDNAHECADWPHETLVGGFAVGR